MKKIIIFLLVLCLFSGCIGGFGFETKDHVLGNYYLVAVDDDIQLDLSYCDPAQNGCASIVEPTVFSVGYNKDYIIVKQHPHSIRRTTNYFILPIKNGAEPQNSDLIGPLTLEEFEQKRKEQNIPDSLKFTIVKKDLK